MSGQPPTLRERALRLLARREHARAELARKLAPHAESAEQLDALLDDLAARRLLSDARYVEMRLNARGTRYGNARLSQELRASGVAAELIDEGLASVDDELTRARQVWRRKFGRASGDARRETSADLDADIGDNDTSAARPDAAGRGRQIAFLQRRGFSSETIRRLLRGDPEED